MVDLRNHGESDHHSSMTYEEMAADLIRFFDSRGLDQVTLIGHNIGGKTALATAGLYSDRVKGVISLDTAPTGTSDDKRDLTRASIEGIKALPVEGKTRKAASDIIS